MARLIHLSRCTSPAPRTHSSPAKKRSSTPKAALTGSKHARRQPLNVAPSWLIRRKSETQPPQPRLSKTPLAETTTPNQQNRPKRLRNSRKKPNLQQNTSAPCRGVFIVFIQYELHIVTRVQAVQELLHVFILTP